MRQLGILYRLISNYFFNPNFRGGNYNRSVLSHVVFLLNLSILYNLLCALWVKGYNKAFANNSLAKAVSRGFLSKGFLFGGLRFLGPEQKNRFFQSVVLSEMPPQQATQFGSNSEPISLLQHQGYANLGQFFDAEQCEGVRNYFCSSRGFASQVPLQSDGELQLFDLEDLKKRQAKSYFCFPDETSLRCDAIKNVLRDGSFQAMADAYLGFPAKLYSVNTFMSLTDPGDHYVTRFHRDYDDFGALAFFIYWNDTSPANGATIYVPGSHLSSAADMSRVVHLAGNAGTIFALDAFGIHAGNKMVDKFRLVTWFRYGMVPNLATVQNKISSWELNDGGAAA
ncbi:MAG: phytanoyl-CoA dioxygenase family protein [Xanthobacteraceae bacterium]